MAAICAGFALCCSMFRRVGLNGEREIRKAAIEALLV